jgi:hypothetical protein
LRRGLIVAALVFSFSALMAAPSVHWLDSGSLVASAWTMGVAHPPGEPLWLAFARIAQLIPIGDIAFRCTLFSALCLGLCAFPLIVLMEGLRGSADDENAEGSAVAAGLVLAALVGLSAQLQSGRPEVYAPTALLLLVALAAGSRGGLTGLCAIGFLLGLGAGLHPLLCVAAAPALVAAAFLRPALDSPARPVARELIGGVLAGLAGLGVLAWLPLRAAANPAGAWGIPDSASRFVDVLLARNFRANFGGETSALLENLGTVAQLWTAELIPCLLLLLLWPLLRGRPMAGRGGAWLLVTGLWLVGNAATILPQNKVFTTNPDLYGYLFVGMLGTLPLALIGLRSLGRIAPVIAAGVLLLQLGQGLQACSSDNFLSGSFATAQSAGLPPGAILMTSGNDTAFTWGYLQRVERRRADLALVHRVLLGHPQEQLRLRAGSGSGELLIPWQPLFQSDPARFLGSFARPFFIERREAEATAFAAGGLRRHGLVGSESWGDDPWLVGLRNSLLAELSEPSFAADAEAGLVRAYYLELWGTEP